MTPIESVFKEEDVTNVASKVLKEVTTKISDNISESFHKEMESYLYEIYDNFDRSLKYKLINETADKYISDPNNYKYRAIRDKLFIENRETIIDSIANDLIETKLNAILIHNSNSENWLAWQWKDGIVKFIQNNWVDFEADERINNGLLAQVRNLTEQIQRQREVIAELSDAAPF